MSGGFLETWDAFRSEIHSRSRFFSTSAENALRSIFGDLSTLRASGHQPVFRKITPDDEAASSGGRVRHNQPRNSGLSSAHRFAKSARRRRGLPRAGG